ncbi:MAG: hypothetical protein CMJ76_12565 [Planctomycetaceae bacterium]|nr:hypothetical protein [Planctomycetaceae bacterium]
MFRRSDWIIVLLLTLRTLPAFAQQQSLPEGIYSASPEASVKFFDIPTGMEIELVASEPQVIDPIAIRSMLKAVCGLLK